MLNGKGPRVTDLKPFTDSILQRVQQLSPPQITDVLFRIFYYDCRPYGGKVNRPDGTVHDFALEPAYHAATAFQRDLKTYPQLALRLGDLSFDGWKIDPHNTAVHKPDFKQKSVDMKIGLDIAWMASKKIVDKIVLVAGDSDFIAPMKFARREGMLVYLETMQQAQIKIELKEHSDFLL